jgi:phenylacetate-coenzyme A ligase PaaK-like adenylate-forming protein
MFVVARQAESVCLSFDQVSRFQIAVMRQQQRDVMALKIELKRAFTEVERSKLSADLVQKFQDVCRIKPDLIDFVTPGTIAQEEPKIVDQRTWE